MDKSKVNFAESMKKLEEINTWFQNEDIDLDEGLKKLREGKKIIKKCRDKLVEVENEFIKIKEEFTPEKTNENIVTFTSDKETVNDEEPASDEIPF